MTTVVCWNIERSRKESWGDLREMDVDVALLQEAGKPPSDLCHLYSLDTLGDQDPWEPWEKEDFGRRPFGAAVAKLSNRVKVEWFKRVLPVRESPACDELPVSGMGTIAAARVWDLDSDQEPFIAVSMCANFLEPTVKSWWTGYSDASAHRIISDLSTFIGHKDPSRHRILAAGDLNIIYGATDNNSLALAARECTVFERMDALGLKFMGPQFPNGRRAEPTPSGLPTITGNVPTFCSRLRKQSPETAVNQLDYVFASKGFHKSVTVRAVNDIDEWGPSDHCRLLIEIK